MEPLLRTRDVAKILGTSSDTVNALRKSGHLPCIKLSQRGIRFQMQDLQAYLDGHKESQVPLTANEPDSAK